MLLGLAVKREWCRGAIHRRSPEGSSSALEQTSCGDSDADDQGDSSWQQLGCRLHGAVAQIFIIAAVVAGAHQISE